VPAPTTANGSCDSICGTRVAVIAIKDAGKRLIGTTAPALYDRANWGSSKKSSIHADDNKVNTKNEDGGNLNVVSPIAEERKIYHALQLQDTREQRWVPGKTIS
jgi:hypothetical protein